MIIKRLSILNRLEFRDEQSLSEPDLCDIFTQMVLQCMPNPVNHTHTHTQTFVENPGAFLKTSEKKTKIHSNSSIC